MREKLIDLLSVDLSGSDGYEPELIADHLIANGVVIAKMETTTKWIPMTERLPESGKCVLVYSGSGMVAEGSYSAYDKKWVQFRWNVKDLEVTHWMPLPEPPKGE